MKRLAFALALLGLMAGLGHAELQGQTVSANAGAQTVTINAKDLTVVNNTGGNEIYVRIFEPGETVVAATSSDHEIDAGEGFAFSKSGGIKAISIVCASGETATVRLFFW